MVGWRVVWVVWVVAGRQAREASKPARWGGSWCAQAVLWVLLQRWQLLPSLTLCRPSKHGVAPPIPHTSQAPPKHACVCVCLRRFTPRAQTQTCAGAPPHTHTHTHLPHLSPACAGCASAARGAGTCACWPERGALLRA
eukprot:124871-Chlamydomonas_euryale.AAC.2